MDQVHGVDVSWLHTPNKGKQASGLSHEQQHLCAVHSDQNNHTDAPQENQQRKHASSTSSVTKDTKPPASTNGDLPAQTHHNHTSSDPSKHPAPSHVTPPSLSQPKQNSEPAVPTTPTPPSSTTPNKNQSNKRPNLLSRVSTEKSNNNEEPRQSRRPSWINNISSRFSSQSTPQRPAPAPQQTPPKSPPATNGNTTAGAQKGPEESESVEPYIPSKPKDSGSFFSSLTRKLSSASQSSGIPKVQGNGGVCPRKVLNVDPNRERCLVPELDQSKLRRVSFCVDVEIAGGPKYTEDPTEDDAQRKRKKKDVKLKERAEGEALKHPDAITEEKDEQGEPTLEAKSKAVPVPGQENKENGETLGASVSQEDVAGSPTVGSLDDGTPGMTRKKEKKKRSEMERKERKEKKLRRAQENGSIPVEMTAQDDDDDSEKGSLAGSLPNGAANATPNPPVPSPTKQDRPTTDPVRIYRRCCQLRETPILKRITEQLMSPKCAVVNEPGVVGCLDLAGSRLQLADVVTLGDWLAVVPVKRLIMEDADLNDEGVRVVLAGLLAAKRPEPTRRKNNGPKHRERPVPPPSRQERSGIVEKISFKNNPRVTRLGWKHISLFLYMCRSIKAVDLSMNQFPETMPLSTQLMAKKNPEKSPPPSGGQELNAAETLYKCLSERLGGSHLEELSVSECGLSVDHVRKIIDGAMMCGISRLGLAGNHLTDESLEHVIHYIRSGVCHGLDLGGNDLRGKLGMIADTFSEKTDTPVWGLSLADCNLDTSSVKPLFPALVKLPNFRFIDLSHNRDLCGEDNGTISLLRRYIPQMQELKRIHLSDVGMSTKQAIALAEVLPEGPRLAHLSILENPQLKALANATDEAGQEEACALYASLMTAVRVSKTLICIDIDVSCFCSTGRLIHVANTIQVPSPESNEIVKALAKQVVAYSLRNMEHFAIAEATGDTDATANAAASLTAPHGGEDNIKGVVVPDVLMHLVGHVDGSTQNADDDDPAPDDDYIVGGTGVVKALQYVLGEKANDMRKTSRPSTPISGRFTPTGERAGSSAGLDQEGNAKAKQMSKDLLNSARKIRTRLQPALIKEATAGDEMAYRRLLFLDQTLLSMIQRFEEEFPDTRVAAANDNNTTPEERTNSSLASSFEASTSQNPSERAEALVHLPADADEADDEALKPAMSRHNSDASLASRALTLEEGRLHRLGQHLRREVVDLAPPSPGGTPTPNSNGIAGSEGAALPNASSPSSPEAAAESHRQRLDVLKERLESTPGSELGPLVEEIGWKAVLEKVGANLEDLRALQEQDPEGWEQFRDSQLKARMNV